MLTHSLKLRKPLAVIDLETTGVNVAKDKIVELCIAKAKLDGTVEVKTKLINPGIPIPLETSLIHGIYDEDVKDAPTFRDIASKVMEMILGRLRFGRFQYQSLRCTDVGRRVFENGC